MGIPGNINETVVVVAPDTWYPANVFEPAQTLSVAPGTNTENLQELLR